MFLCFEFGASVWRVEVARPLAAFRAPIEFRRSVLLTLALGVWLVVLASNVLLRHRLDPVAKLQAATQRVAAGDFSATVTLSTRDELEDLASAFNAMAGGLREQFALLGALHDVHREALVGQTEIEVARAAVRHFGELFPVEEASLVIQLGSADTHDAALVWRMTTGGEAEQERSRIPGSAFAQLEQSAHSLVVGPNDQLPALVREVSRSEEGASLVLPLCNRGSCFAAIVLVPRSPLLVLSDTDVGRARQIADQTALALAHSRLVQRLNAMSWGTLQALARSIDAASPWTAGHSERVTQIGMAIGRRLGLAPEMIDRLHRGGLLHDVGKIGVPSTILDKPGKLDDAEFRAIRAHPVIGARILEPIHAYEDVIPIVRHHHERYDGTGYPDGLKGRGIPLLARVLSVADVYDALVSRRPYREGWSHEAALEYIVGRAGVEFDPDVVGAFQELAGDITWGANANESSEAAPILVETSG